MKKGWLNGALVILIVVLAVAGIALLGKIEPSFTPKEIPDEERRELVVEFVADRLEPELIGELRIESEHDSNVDWSYRVVEYYNGIQTGASALVLCTDGGAITDCMLKHGSVFEKDQNGNIRLTGGQTVEKPAQPKVSEGGIV